MIYGNNNYTLFENDNIKDNDLLQIESNLSSEKQRILETKNKLDNSHKNNNKSRIKIFQSNYSFSDKTILNELSKPQFESAEEELLSFDKKSNGKKYKKEKPLYLSHSDYFYCPESKTEKNLNKQIMKYLYENNLISKKNSTKIQKSDNYFNIDYNNFEIKGIKRNSMKGSKILEIVLDNNKGEKKAIKRDSKIKNNKQYLYIPSLNDKIQQYLQKMNCNNFNTQINQINNIKIKNIYITNNGNINNYKENRKIKKTEDSFHKFKINKVNNSKTKINRNNISFNSNLFYYNTCSNNNIYSPKNKVQNKNSKRNIFNKMNTNKNKSLNKIIYQKSLDILYNNKKVKKHNNDNIIEQMENKYQIDSNIINEKIISKDKNNKKNKYNLSTISLQSINDSKLMLIAGDMISKNEEIDK